MVRYKIKYVLLLVLMFVISTTSTSAADFAFRERFSSIFDEKQRVAQISNSSENRKGLAFGSILNQRQGELTLVAGLSSKFSLAFTANYNKVQQVTSNNDLLNGAFRSQKKSAGLDTDLRYHPWKNGFFGSFGFRAGKNESQTSSSLTGNQTIKLAGYSYGKQSLTNIKMTKVYNKFAPRFMVGFDNSLQMKKRFGFHFAAGFIYQGHGKTTYDVTYANNLNPLTNANLPRHISEASNGAFVDKSHKAFLPTASAGFKIRF